MDKADPLLYIAIAALISLSAFFSSCETSISSFNRIRMKKQAQSGDSQAQRLLSIADNYDRAISSILIGNNIANIGASTIATVAVTALLGPGYAWVATVVMTLLILTFGEILPKTYSMAHADALAPKLSGPLRFVLVVLSPLSFFFSKLGSLFPRQEEEDAIPSVTEEELMYIIESIEEEGVLEEQERDLVQSALEFDETTIREIITPRVQLVALDVDAAPEEITETVLTEGYSRMPVYEDTVDNIIGILYTRDYLRCLVRGEPRAIRELMAEPYFVHKGMKLSLLLQNFKIRKAHMAVALDEYGGTLGIVTMEDLLEELVGDILDEGDDEEPVGMQQLDDTRFAVRGEYDILDMFTELGYGEMEPEGGHATVSGWVIHMLEHIPEHGEAFRYQDLELTVLETDGHRVTRLLVEKYPPEQTGSATKR